MMNWKQLVVTILAVGMAFLAPAQKYISEHPTAIYDDDRSEVIDVVFGGVVMEQLEAKGEGKRRWIRVEAATDPVVTGWVKAARLQEVEFDAEGNMIRKEQPAQQEPELGSMETVAFLAATPILLFLVGSLAIFFLFFIFNFSGLKAWLNRKAGKDISPQDRFDKLLWRFIPFFATIAAGAALISEVGGVLSYVLAVATPIICWRFMVGQRAAHWGSRRAARWEMIYIAYAGYSVLFICLILWWALLLYLGFKVIHSFVTAPSQYTCKECYWYCDCYCEYYEKRVAENEPSCPKFNGMKRS